MPARTSLKIRSVNRSSFTGSISRLRSEVPEARVEPVAEPAAQQVDREDGQQDGEAGERRRAGSIPALTSSPGSRRWRSPYRRSAR